MTSKKKAPEEKKEEAPVLGLKTPEKPTSQARGMKRKADVSTKLVLSPLEVVSDHRYFNSSQRA